jgi:hypothetical protein
MFGFINRSGKWIIQPIFERAENFSEGFAAVKENGRWGYINRNGQYEIQPQYDYAMRFSDGMAPVYMQMDEGLEEWFIDRQGAKQFRIILKEDEWYSDFHDGLLRVCKGGKFGFIDKSGKTVIDYIYDYADDFSEGRALVLNEEDKTIKCGYIKTNGEDLIPLDYLYVSPFKEGFAVAISGTRENHMSYIFDEHGSIVNSIKGNLDQFKSGLASFTETVSIAKPPKKYPAIYSSGLMDVFGNKFLDPSKYHCYFVGEAIRVQDIVIDFEKEKYSYENTRYLDIKGNLLFNDTDLYDQAPFDFKDEFDQVYVNEITGDVAIVYFSNNTTEDKSVPNNQQKSDHYFAAITTDGKMLTITQAIDKCYFYRDNTLVGWDNEESSFVFVGKEGVPLRRRLDSTSPQYHYSLWAVSENGKWGYLDTTGRYAITPQFLWAGAFHSVE